MGFITDWKPTKDENPNFKCQDCESNDIEYREWESSDGGHEDYKYRCNNCCKEWWVEGSDA